MEIKTKFNNGDRAWFMKNNKPTEMIVSAIEIFAKTDALLITYNGWDFIDRKTWIDHYKISEGCLFHSKNELLKSL